MTAPTPPTPRGPTGRPTNVGGPKGPTGLVNQKPLWIGPFLLALRECGNILRACEIAGISRQHAYYYRDRNPEFREQWTIAIEDAVDTLEGEAWRRARDGVKRLKFAPDGSPYEELQFSDTLLIFLLKAYRDRFKERPSVSVNFVLSSAERLAEMHGYDTAEVLDAITSTIAGEAFELPAST